MAAAAPRGSAVTDTLFGTRTYTEGAQYQIPRKIPLRVEPKTYFALERTYLSWMHMAVMLGGITSALVGLTAEAEDGEPAGKPGRRVSHRTTELIALLLLPISMLMARHFDCGTIAVPIVYALFVYYFRSKNLERKQYGFFDDKLGPVTLCVLIMLSLTAIMVIAISDFVSS